MINEKVMQKLKTNYPADVAAAYGISEGELTNIRLAYDATILYIPDVKFFITDLELLGHVKCITRNNGVISVQEGIFTNQHLYGFNKINISAETGLVLNPRKLDLRVYFKHWNYVYYIKQYKNQKVHRSFQIFDCCGLAVHKIFITEHSSESGLSILLKRYSDAPQTPPVFNLYREQQAPVMMDEGDFKAEIDADWRTMKHARDFTMLAEKYEMKPQALFRSVSEELAWKVSKKSLYNVFKAAREFYEELTISVSNRGCMQIYTGLLDKIYSANGWLNVLNPQNNIHIRESKIDECWIVRRPDGGREITSLEIFSKENEPIIQIQGQQDDGEQERASWRNIIDHIV